jgi:hypothetical protein
MDMRVSAPLGAPGEALRLEGVVPLGGEVRPVHAPPLPELELTGKPGRRDCPTPGLAEGGDQEDRPVTVPVLAGAEDGHRVITTGQLAVGPLARSPGATRAGVTAMAFKATADCDWRGEAGRP